LLAESYQYHEIDDLEAADIRIRQAQRWIDRAQRPCDSAESWLILGHIRYQRDDLPGALRGYRAATRSSRQADDSEIGIDA
jgi:cytochrome c-type biogenesis protein CcmH/NrfG